MCQKVCLLVQMFMFARAHDLGQRVRTMTTLIPGVDRGDWEGHPSSSSSAIWYIPTADLMIFHIMWKKAPQQPVCNSPVLDAGLGEKKSQVKKSKGTFELY